MSYGLNEELVDKPRDLSSLIEHCQTTQAVVTQKKSETLLKSAPGINSKNLPANLE